MSLGDAAPLCAAPAPAPAHTPLARGSSALLPSGRMARRKSPADVATDEVREQVKARALGQCQARIPGVCIGQGAHAHHLMRRPHGKATLANLAWLCSPCHGYVHAEVAWSLACGLLRSRYGTPSWLWTPDSPDRPPYPREER